MAKRDRLTDLMMLPLTLYSSVFLWPERGKLEYFLLFEMERRRLRQRRRLPVKNKWRIRERIREKETLDRTNNVGLISLCYSLFFTITFQMFLFYLFFF